MGGCNLNCCRLLELSFVILLCCGDVCDSQVMGDLLLHMRRITKCACSPPTSPGMVTPCVLEHIAPLCESSLRPWLRQNGRVSPQRAEWGPVFWRLIASTASLSSSRGAHGAFEQWFRLLGARMLPCANCRENFTAKYDIALGQLSAIPGAPIPAGTEEVLVSILHKMIEESKGKSAGDLVAVLWGLSF